MIKHVYLIKNVESNQYKIGFTNNVKRRMRNLQVGNESKLKFISSFPSQYYSKIESSLHRFFKSKQTNGEWFIFDSSIELERTK